MIKKYASITIVIGLAVFLFTNSALIKRGKIGDCLPDNTLNSAFFIGDNMPSGVYERTKKAIRICSTGGCKGKHKGKGLCKKHYDQQYRQEHKKETKQYFQDNKIKIARQSKQWREDNKEHCVEYRKINKEHRAEYNKQWREDNQEHYNKLAKQWREDNKDKCAEYVKINTIKRKEKYHSDKKYNLKISIDTAKFQSKKLRKNKKYRKEYILKRNKDRAKKQTISKRTSAKYRIWTISEIDYLKQNYKKKTSFEIAMELNRTLFSIHGAIRVFGIGRKTRILKGKYYK